MIRRAGILLLVSLQAQAGTNWFQDGMNYGQSQMSASGNAQTMSAAGQTTINNLNQGTNLVQPNSTDVMTMQGYGTQGNANGSGLGSFGTGNVNSCAGYVIGTGGPSRDAECNAVGFASQTTNLNAQANSAYGITGQSAFLQNALQAGSTSAANMNNLLPATSTSVSGSTTCVQQPAQPIQTTQSCYVYNSQSTGGGAVTTWGAGTSVSEVCTGGANLATTTCTINPPQASVNVSCLSLSQNSSTGTANVIASGAQTTVTCSGGSVLTNNTCTVSPSLQTTSQAMCYSQQQNGSSGTQADYLSGASIAVTCTAPANLSTTNCTVTTPLDAQTTNQSCQVSVPVNRTCSQIASASISTTTIHWCVSGTYALYDGSTAWGGSVPNWSSNPSIGSATVTCTGQYTFNLTLSVPVGSFTLTTVGQTAPFALAYGTSWSVPVDVVVSSNYRGTIRKTVVAIGTVSWDGASNLSFGASNSYAAYSFTASIPIGTQTYQVATPTYADGCAQWANM